MKTYFQQRLKLHLDGYWSVDDKSLEATLYKVNDETGEIVVEHPYYIDLLQQHGRQWQMQGRLSGKFPVSMVR